MSQPSIEGRPRDGRFGAATPGIRAERAGIGDLVTAPARSARRRVITPWRLTALVLALAAAGGSYMLGRYVIAPKSPHSVQLTVTAVALPAGAKLTTGDVRVVTVQAASVPSGFFSPAAALSAIGLVTRDAIPAGTFLSNSMLSPSGGVPDSAQALVGLDLKAGQLPAGGLAPGQKVLVVLLPVNFQGTALSPISLVNTTVWDLQPPDASGDVEATVVVPNSMATTLASYAARGEVSLVATAAPPAPATLPSSKKARHAAHGSTTRNSHK
jgi:hypothetical protein